MEKTALDYFGNPRMLWLLVLALPVLACFFWWSRRKRRQLIAQFVQSRLLSQLTVGVSSSRQIARLALAAAAVALMILALARPRSGIAWEEAVQEGRDFIIAIDTSRSMLAKDIAPDRMTRAKLAALDLMRLAQNDRLGLVAFAGTAFLQCPLTSDSDAFRQSVAALEVGIIPMGGTILSEAIDTAIDAFDFETESEKALILLTDGENHEQKALTTAARAAKAGIRIFTVGIGTLNGDLLLEVGQNGVVSYVKDPEGNVVKSRLNELLLAQIATVANGFYLPLTGPDAIDVLYRQGLNFLERSRLSNRLFMRFNEHYQWFAAAAILLLVLEMFLPDRKHRSGNQSIGTPAIGAGFRKVISILIAAGLVHTASASARSALKEYEKGQFEEAQREFELLLARRPDDIRLSYNAGASAYKAGAFGRAIEHFSASLRSPDLQLQERSYYNLGNSLYRLGESASDLKKRRAAWELSIKHYQIALKLDPNDENASANLNFVRKRIADLLRRQAELKDNNTSDKDSGEDKRNPSNSNSPETDSDRTKAGDTASPDSESSSEKVTQDDEHSADSGEPSRQSEESALPGQTGSTGEGANPGQGAQNSSSNSEGRIPGFSDAAPGPMTPAQARRLLDAQKNDEKPMIFAPNTRRSEKPAVLKDW